MHLGFNVLGSGSLGNATLLVLEEGRRCVLVDCGLSPRRTKRSLVALGFDLDDITDILFTHFDRDHYCRSWAKVIRTLGITAHVYERHRHRAIRDGLPLARIALFRTGFELDPDTTVDAIPLAHDDLGTVGFVIDHRERRLGYATDVGQMTESALLAMSGLHALAIESNYDPRLERSSSRPPALKRRVMSGRGHLSNEQSITAVIDIEARSRLSHVVPLHLSRQCNDPGLVRQLYRKRAPHLLDRLTISNQVKPTGLLEVVPGPMRAEQMSLFA